MKTLLDITTILFVGLFYLTNSLFAQEKSDCKAYFTFDRVDHYEIEISSTELNNLEEKGLYVGDTLEKTNEEIELLEILTGEKLNHLKDTIQITQLPELGFQQNTLDKNQIPRMEEIFCFKPTSPISISECLPVYRDILVFRLQDEIVGIVKLCFSCHQSTFTETRFDPIFFGQNDEFEVLKEILK